MRKFSKSLLVVIVILAITVISAWIAIISKSKLSGNEAETIKIGVIAPLTSDMSNWGSSMKGGIELAVSEWNGHDGINGKKIQLIFEDNKSCDKTEAVTAFNKLANVDKVKAVIVGCSGSVLSVAPLAEQNKIILLTTLASAAKISQAGDYVFRTCISDAVQGKNLADFLYNKLDTKDAAVIYVNNDYGVGFLDAFKTTFESAGGKIVDSEVYQPESTDFRTFLIKIKARNPSALVIISYGSEGGLIAKQTKEMGINSHLIGSDNFGVKEVVAAGGKAVEGTIFVTSALDDKNKKVQDLKSSYILSYKTEPPIMSAVANSYDGTNLLLSAIKSKGYNADSIKDYLYAVKNYDGVSGIINMDKNGDANMPSTIQQIKNGNFLPYSQ